MKETTSNMVFYIIREYFLTPSETGLLRAKRSEAAGFGIPIINKRRVLGKKVAPVQKLILNRTTGCRNLAFDFWGSWHPIILVLVNPKGHDSFTGSHSANPTKLQIEKQIGPFLGLPEIVASNTSPMPNRADITSFLGEDSNTNPRNRTATSIKHLLLLG